MFGKQTTNIHQPHPTSGELFLESTDSSNPVDLHNLDMMSDFLSSAPAMLGGPLFGGTRGQGQTGMSMSMAMRQVPTHPPLSNRDDYPGDLTATEAVKAVTQLLEASSRKLQRVTEDQGGEESRVPQRNVDAMNVRLDRTGQRPGPAPNPAVPPIPVATAQAILQARARELIALEDEEDSDIDAFSVDGDVEAFDEDDEDEAYYSDEEYDDDEEYDEDGATYDGEESDYSHDGGSSCYDSEDDEADDEEHYPVAEVMPFHAPIRRKHPDDPSNDPATRPPNDPSTPPRPHYSTIPYLPGSRRNPVTGKQMREILDRLSPAARHNYQQALIREHQLEMEMKERQEGQPLQQQIPPPQNRQPSVLDDPVVMASPLIFFLTSADLAYRIKLSTNCSHGSRPSYGRSNNMPSAQHAHRWKPRV